MAKGTQESIPDRLKTQEDKLVINICGPFK